MDCLFTGGFFHTLCDEREIYSCLGVRGETICYLSNEAPPAGSARKMVDLGGLHAYPALTDAHLHLMSSIALAASSFFVCALGEHGIEPRDMAGVQRKIRAFCAQKKPEELIVCNNYIVAAIAERRLPTRVELDEWCGGRRAVVYTIDGHSSALSAAMMAAAGLDATSHDGILSGAEHEFNQGAVTGAVASAIGARELARGIANFTNICHSYGIARICALEGNGDTGDDKLTRLLVQFMRRMDLAVRFYPQYRDIEQARPYWKYMRRPRVGGCGEWEMDGAVGSHSAAFHLPFADSGECAECYYTPQQVAGMVAAADQNGCQSAMHAIGDLAIRLALDAQDTLPAGRFNRIEHFEFPNAESVERLCQNKNVAITVQPGFAWLDKRYMNSYTAFLPPEIIAQQVPLKTLVRAGVCVCGSTDSPVQSVDPFLQMLGMIDFYLPKESLSMYEALCSYTRSPAVMLGEEAESGTLEVGKRADFFTTENNLLRADRETLPLMRVRGLYTGGKAPRVKRGTLWELAAMFLRPAKKI